MLPVLDDVPGSDFINASYLTNPQKKVRVIAAQGPLSSTVLDFWRMLWCQNTTVVVMVARVVEMGKVQHHHYPCAPPPPVPAVPGCPAPALVVKEEDATEVAVGMST